jgi:hypothetical protein
MIEADARVLLRDCGGFGGLEAWIAGRRWKTVAGGRISFHRGCRRARGRGRKRGPGCPIREAALVGRLRG